MSTAIMKTLLFVSLIALILEDFSAFADDVTSKSADPCASVCNNYNDMCIPESVDPQNAFHPHCVGNNDVKRPPVRCLVCIKQNGLPEERPTTATTINKEPTSETTKCEGPCGCDCNVKDTCMPAKLDPEGYFPTHCKGEDDENYPSQLCVHCLIKHGVLGNETGKTTTLGTDQDTSTTTTPKCTRPPSSTPDPCLAFCDYYVQICMPPDIDPCFYYYPHCDNDVEGYRQASVNCLKCVNIHGLKPNSLASVRTSELSTTTSKPSSTPPITLPWECFCSRIQTTIIEEPTKKCPKKGKDCVFSTDKGVTSEEWSCSCGPLKPIKKIKKHFFADEGSCDNCPFGMTGDCTCKRTVKITSQVKIDTCTGFSKNHERCQLQDPAATEETRITNECSCKDCNWWDSWW